MTRGGDSVKKKFRVYIEELEEVSPKHPFHVHNSMM
jgi:hypothetical protein